MKFARMRHIFAFILSVSIVCVMAQPANDQCAAAQVVTPDGTCVNGTTVAATDNWTSIVGCQTGLPGLSHRDVWYSFTATGSNYRGTLTAGAGWTGTMEFTLATGTCTGGFTIVGSACGASPLNVNINGLVSGNTYYFTVSNAYNGTPGAFSICSRTLNPTCTGVACASPAVVTYTAGVQTCVTGCNTGLAPGPDFTGTNCNDFPAATTWYSITTGSGTASIELNLTSAALTNPYITVFRTTNCQTFTTIDCKRSTAGSVRDTVIVAPSTTYLIAVSDVNGAEGSFNLCVKVNNDNSACNKNQSLAATATSMGSPLTGPYLPGEIVTFCYNVTNYTQYNCNYMQGFVPTFGNCWDPVSFNAQGRPVNITTPLTAAASNTLCPGPAVPAGTWSWFTAGTVVYNNITGSLPPNTPLGAGWFFLSSYNPSTQLCNSTPPTDPDNSFGDGAMPFTGTCPTNTTLGWQVCFQLQARAFIACTNGQTDCSVRMKSYADGEIGTYANIGCTVDIPAVFPATLCCAAPPTAAPVAVCAGTTATLTATGCSTGTLDWYAAATGGPSLGTGTTFTTPAINASTTYYVACTDGGCTSTRTPVAVTMNARPTVAPTASPVAICNGGSTTLAANATAGSGTISTYAWSSGPVGNVAGGSVSPTTATTYTVTVTNSNNCSASGSVSVTVGLLPTVAPTAAPTTLCSGANTTLAANATAGSGTISTYAWSSGLAGSVAGGSVSPTGNTTYRVTVTNSDNCSASGSVSVNVNAAPVVAPTAAPAAICNGASTTLAANATAGSGTISTYAWSSGPAGNVAGGSVSPTANTTYTVTVTNSNNCSTTASVAVTVNALPTVAPSATPATICNGASTTLAANAAAGSGTISTYAWSSGLAGNVAGGSVSPTGNTTYTVTVTNSNNCTVTGSVVVTVSSALTVAPTATPGTICSGASSTLAANATAGSGTISTYAWSSGITGNLPGGSVSPAGTTTYTVTVTNSNNCSVSGTVTVTVNPSPVATINPATATLTCTNTSVLLTAGGGTSYQWSTIVSGPSITVSTPNTYSVTATDANNCTASASSVVSQNITPPVASVTPATFTLTCTNPFVDLTASGGGTYLWNSGAGVSSVTVTSPNTYIVTVTNSTNGCTATASATISQNNTAPVANVTPASANLTCIVTTAALTASGGGTYTWNNGGGNMAVATVSSPNTYTLTVTDAANGCTATASAVVTQNITPPVASVTPTSAVLNCTTTSATLTAGGGGTYTWSNSGNTAVITVTTPNTYTVTVTDGANGCTATAAATVTQTAVPPVAVINPATYTLTCAVTSATLTASGGSTYLWSTGPTTNAITVTTPNTYTVTVTDGTTGCTASASAVVSQDLTPPVAAISPASAILTCTDPSIALTASGGGTYLWNSGGSTNTVNVSSPNTYTVTVTSAVNGCTAAASVIVGQNNTPPVASVTRSNAILTCTAATATLTASGGGTYLWSNGDNTAVTTVSTANTYIVTVTDATNGCTATASAVVSQNTTPPAASVSPTSAVLNCTTQNATLTASGGGDYLWSNGDNTAAITVSTPNTYTVTVTEPANGCTATAAATVTQTAVPPVATITPATVALTCATTSATLTAAGGGTYQWSTGVSTNAITVTTPNTYTVTITDTNTGCTATASAVVSQDLTPPVAAVTPATATLTCSTASAVLTASGGGSYLWSTGGATNSITVTTPNTYEVTVTDAANGCTATASAVVNQNITPPVASVTPTTANLLCSSATATLTAGGGGTYVWSTTEITTSITVNSADTYVVTVTDASNGCTATASAVVSSVPAIVLSTAGTNVTCNGGTDGAIDLAVSGGQTPFGIQWSNSAITEDIGNIAAGNYSVTVTDAVNCTATATAAITEPTALLATETHINVSCNGYTNATIDVTTTNGTPPYSYLWNDAAATEDRNNVAPGAYSLTVTDNNLCTATVQLVVTEPNGMTVSSAVNQPTCETIAADGEIAMTVTGSTTPYSYLWSHGASTPTVSQLAAGNYSVSITDANNCSASNSFSLAYQYVFDVDVTPPVYINLGDEAQLTYTISGTSGNTTGLWSPAATLSCADCSTTVASPMTTTEYIINIKNDSGCTAVATTTVYVNPVYDIFIPSGFSPNGDGNNDVFQMYGNLKDIAYMDMQIFNRWGEKVFESNDHNFTWDGAFKSAPQVSQVFIWQVKIVWIDGHREEWRKGSVTIMK